MQATETLRGICEDFTALYGDERIHVQFAKQPRITASGDTIYVWPNPAQVLDLDMSGPAEFAVIRDTVNHEVGHALWSKLDNKKAIAMRHDGHERLAGMVANILEDAYVDARRMREWPGLRRPHSYFVHSQMQEKSDISDLPPSKAMVGGLHQLALAGKPIGIEDADEDVRAFLAWARRYIQAVRDEDDPKDRAMLTDRVIEKLIENLPDFDIDDILDELAKQLADGEDADPFDPMDLDPDDVDDLVDALDLPAEPGDDGDGDGDHGRDIDDLLAGHDPSDVKVTN